MGVLNFSTIAQIKGTPIVQNGSAHSGHAFSIANLRLIEGGAHQSVDAALQFSGWQSTRMSDVSPLGRRLCPRQIGIPAARNASTIKGAAIAMPSYRSPGDASLLCGNKYPHHQLTYSNEERSMNDAYGAMNAKSAASRSVDLRQTTSGVSWASVFAGAAAAAALSLILVVLGVGLGFSTVSPWAGQGASSTAVGATALVWLAFTQLAASGMGGYLAGRLRTRWSDLHTDEVYFRDTAHGFLAWALGTLVTAAMLTSAIGAVVSGGAKAGAALSAGAATAAVAAAAPLAASATAPSGSGGSAYFVDLLFRRDPAAPPAAPASAGPAPDAARTSSEVGRIFASALSSGTLPAEDAQYVGSLIAGQTGMAQPAAEKRVTDTFTRLQTKAREAEASVREAADKARKASAYASLWTFVSLLAGAFVASLCATYGGRRRDLF